MCSYLNTTGRNGYLLCRVVSGQSQCCLRSFSSEIKDFSEMPTLELSSLPQENSELRLCFKNHGPVFKTNKDDQWTVFAYGAEAANSLYKSEGKWPNRGRLITEAIANLHKANSWRASMAFASGNDWKRIRSRASQQGGPRWAWSWAEQLGGIADNMAEKLGPGLIEDIRPLTAEWSYQGLLLLVTGEISNRSQLHNELMAAGSQVVHGLRTVTDGNHMHYSKYYDDFVRSFTRMRQLGGDIIVSREKCTVQPGLLDEWLDNGTFSEEEAVSLCSDLLATSYEATANAATFLLFELAKQPRLQDQLHEELGEVESPAAIRDVLLLRHCIKEILRIYPPLAIAKRGIMREAFIRGYWVPPEVNVHVPMALMSHDRALFQRPMEFRPQRWSCDDIQPFSCLPFGFGVRSCYGRRIAEAQLCTLVYKLVRKFEWRTSKLRLLTQYNSGLAPIEPVTLYFSPR